MFYIWYVMWSREISLRSNMWHFQVSIWLKCSFGGVNFAETPPESDQRFQRYQLKDSQNNKKQKKLIPFSSYISRNQCSRLLTDSARSQHIRAYKFVKLFRTSLHLCIKWCFCLFVCFLKVIRLIMLMLVMNNLISLRSSSSTTIHLTLNKLCNYSWN